MWQLGFRHLSKQKKKKSLIIEWEYDSLESVAYSLES